MATPTMLRSAAIANQIRSRILLSGPIPVADYMRLALTSNIGNNNNPSSSPDRKRVTVKSNELGYYMKNDVFGQKGDFITSPEITQMFGELIGVWGIQSWKSLNGPSKFSVVELGPGRGTLSNDMLRVFQQFESVIGNQVCLNLVEISPFLSQLQHETLCGSSANGNSSSEKCDKFSASCLKGIAKNSTIPVTWHKSLKDVPKEFAFYVAHEFFDALPIHKLQKIDNQWKEVLIDILPESKEGFRFVLSRHETPVIKLLKGRYPSLLNSNRHHLEVSLEALVIMEELTSRLEQFGGIAVIVDYGHDGTKEDTFRAFQKHQLHDPLIAPGSADLTADVDFSILKEVFAEKALLCGPVSQKQFLSRIGIDLRLHRLLQTTKSESEKSQLESGYKMIMDEMGTRFHFFGLFPKVLEQFLPKLKFAGFHE